MSQQHDLREPSDPDAEPGTESGDGEVGGWSGRAIGPLSCLLPGGAVDLTAGELPAAELPAAEVPAAELPTGESTSAVQAGEADPASAAAATGAPPGDQEPTASAVADDDEPAAVLTAEAAEATVPNEPGRTDTGDRWHSALVGFVDDPRGSVEAARALIDEDIAAHIALLARCREAMHAAWQADKDADTEALRVALVHYRDLRNKLVDVIATLAVAAG